MKIAILSDSHDNDRLLHNAMSQAEELGAEAVLHCGDVVSANTLKLAGVHHLPLHIIHGNNTGDLFTLAKLAGDPDNQVIYHGQDAGIVLHGKRIFMVHFPHYAHAMATTGDWDLVCCGHSHKVELTTITNVMGTTTAVVNPGTVGGVSAPATFVMADLDTLEFEVIDVTDER